MDFLIFEPLSGASGDMIISSLIDLGADKKVVVDAMESAAKVTVKVSTVKKSGIRATQTTVVQEQQKHRTYKEIKGHIQQLDLPEEIKHESLLVYDLLATAESTVHGVPLSDFHFHEVGQDDAIADIVGACTAMNLLKPKHVRCTPISTGSGFVKTSHGAYPSPAPATLEIIKHSALTIQQTSFEGELLTPTGAALLARFVNLQATLPPLSIVNTGYGAGHREFGHPNILRVISAESEESFMHEAIDVVETNIDDVTGEVLGNLIDRLLEEGARDVCIIPVTMKKNRSGHIIKAISSPDDSAQLARTIMEETGSLGVRIMPARHRLTARRAMGQVQVNIDGAPHTASVKIATGTKGQVIDISPEFEDCKNISKLTGMPVKRVLQKVEEQGWKQYDTYK